MKKNCFFVIVLVIMSTFAFCSCSEPFGRYGKYVSEYRDNVYVGENENFYAIAVTGYRENPFDIDGVSEQNKVEFLLVTVTPAEYNPSVAYSYSITVDGVEYAGEMNKHPFENTYSFEIAQYVSDEQITIYVQQQAVTLSSILTEEYISAEKAFDIARSRLSKSEVIKGGDYEIYVRLIANPINAKGGYFWYVAFVDESQNTVAVLIDPVSMEIVAVRE